MAKQLTNVNTYIGILFLFALLVGGLTILGNELLENDNTNLDNTSVEYIATLNGINISDYQGEEDTQEDPILITGNGTQGNPKDESLEFLFAKEKGFSLELTIKRIFNLPSFILYDLLRLPKAEWSWITDIVGWLLGIVVVIAVVYFARGILDK